MFIGNQQVINYLRQAIANGNLAQVCCLTGLDQVGKSTLVFELICELLGADSEKMFSHPDFYYLNRGVDEKTGKAKKEITVSQIRSLRSFLQNQSWQGGWRVVMIDEAEYLNEESGNALLKNLEEPGNKTLFFLLTRNDSLLLPTIRSRTEIWQLNPVGDDEIENGLIQLGSDPETARRISYLSAGRPGRAIEFFRDEAKLVEWEDEVRRWQDLYKKPLYERLKILEGIIGEKDDSERKETRLQKFIDIWTEEARRELRSTTELSSDHKKSVGLVNIIDSLNEARIMLEQNINPKMVMEKIMLQF